MAQASLLKFFGRSGGTTGKVSTNVCLLQVAIMDRLVLDPNLGPGQVTLYKTPSGLSSSVASFSAASFPG